MACRLASAGLYGGDPEAVLRARGDLVIAAVQFQVFKSDYEDVYLELNRGK